MNIKSIGSQSFTGSRRKFDVQAHTGAMYDGLKNYNVSYSPQQILDTVEINNVQKVLVSSLSGLNPQDSNLYKPEADCAEEMARLSGNEKVKLYPLISCQPGISKDTEVISRLAQDTNFYGMKFHPTNTNQPIKDNFDIYSKYLSVAEKNGLPCVFHSTTDGKSDPVQIIKLAEQHPKLPVVLYHIDLMAQPEQMNKSIDNIANSIKSGKSNLYVDISWITGLFPETAERDKNVLKSALDKIGPDRILFGSDASIGEMGDKDKYKRFTDFIENTVKEFYKDKPDDAEKALNKIFYDNAENLFVKKTWVEKVKSNKLSKGLIAAGVVALGVIAFAISNINKNRNAKK